MRSFRPILAAALAAVLLISCQPAAVPDLTGTSYALTPTTTDASGAADIPEATFTPVPNPTFEAASAPTLTPAATPTQELPAITPDFPPEILKYIQNPVVNMADPFDQPSKTWALGAAKIHDGLLELQGNDKTFRKATRTVALSQGNSLDGILLQFKYAKGSNFTVSISHDKPRTPAYQTFGFSKTANLYPKSSLVNGLIRIRPRTLDGDLQLKPDTWLNLFIGVTDRGEVMLAVWNPEDTSSTIRYIENLGAKWVGFDWDFAVSVKSGDVVLDNFMQITFTDR